MPVICMKKRCHSCKYAHTQIHTLTRSSSSIENTDKHTHTYKQTYSHTYIRTHMAKRTTDNRTWQPVNASEARINYNFRFCWHSRQIRQADWLMDWTNDWRSDWLTGWMTDVCVEFGLKVTYCWPHKRKVRNCQLGNPRKRGTYGGTLKPPSRFSFLWNNLEMSMQVLWVLQDIDMYLYTIYTVTFTYIYKEYCVGSWEKDTLEIRNIRYL